MKDDFAAAYLRLHLSGELAERARRALEHLKHCSLCARCCHVNRLLPSRQSRCGTGENAVVYSFGPHHGEERPISGRKGSGTIFFSHCSLQCVFCQNWEISQKGQGKEISQEELACMMLALQERGCHNINLVTPSHVVPQILAALEIAAGKGLRLPLVYNTSSYDSQEALALLDGVVDIYLPDFKFADSGRASRYLNVEDYAEVCRAAIKEMHRQVGDLALNGTGIAKRGLLIRHLVLPDNLADTDRILDFLVREISPATWLNLMDQYRPCYLADRYPPLDRRPTPEEFELFRRMARIIGLTRVFT